MKITGNEPYYPIVTEEVTDRYQSSPASLNNNIQANGITIRQQLAAMAMQGYLASFTGVEVSAPEKTAERAVKYATALINELNKTEV